MLTALTTIGQLTSSDIQRRKRRAVSAVLLYAVAGFAALFAVGFGSAAGAVALAQTYDWRIALVVMAAIFVLVAAVAVIVNAILARRARRKLDRSAAVKSAALATGLVAARRSGTAALPLAAVAIGLLVGSRLLGGGSPTDT